MSQSHTSAVKKPVRQGQFIPVKDKAIHKLQNSLDCHYGCDGNCGG